MLMTNNSSIQEVLFFPQMRPEKKQVELSESEKVIFDILKKNKEMPLEALKQASELSNKAWDKSIKALGKMGITKVTKTETELLVSLQE
jgi:lysyl-tRNA synthetase class 2